MVFGFHGIGVYFNIGGIVADFDYSLGDFIYKGFQAFKFKQFVDSYPGSSELLKINSNFYLIIDEMLDLEIIKRKPAADPNTYEYIRIV